MHLLIIGAGNDLPVLARRASPGLRTSVICQQRAVAYLREPERIERLVVLPPAAPPAEWVAAGRYIHAAAPVERIANYTEYDTDKTAAIAEDLGLAAPAAETYRLISDKCAMRSRLAAAGVDDTPAALVRSAAEVREFVARAGYPLICKPVSGVGSRGVSLLAGDADIGAALTRGQAGAVTLDERALMVERCHRGPEYSVEAVSERGRHLVACVTRKYTDPEGFVEIGHVLPAPLAEGARRAIGDTVTAALTALGVRDGITHTEVLLDGGQVRIIETHLRPGGDRIPAMLARARGIDLENALARQSVGQPVLAGIRRALRWPDRPAGYAAIWYAMPDRAGELVRAGGGDAAAAIAGVREVAVLASPGDQVRAVTMSADRLGYAWATGPSPERALGRARQAVAALRFEVR
ncbi:MAG TPA: ATP-grasp domain-containing protein [Streptosporangiaceae bacterium]